MSRSGDVITRAFSRRNGVPRRPSVSVVRGVESWKNEPRPVSITKKQYFPPKGLRYLVVSAQNQPGYHALSSSFLQSLLPVACPYLGLLV